MTKEQMLSIENTTFDIMKRLTKQEKEYNLKDVLSMMS